MQSENDCEISNGSSNSDAVNSMLITGPMTAKQKVRQKGRPRPLRGLQVDSSLTRNVPYAIR